MKWLVGAFVFCNCTFSFAQVTTPANNEKDPYEHLLSKNEREREAATDRILRANTTLDLVVRGNFEALQRNLPDDFDRFGKPYANIIWLLGELRVKEAQRQLLGIVDFQLDPTSVPIASSPQAIEYYPAAYALVRIGDIKSVSTLFEGINRPISDIRLRLYSYLLKELIGKGLALQLVQQNLTVEEEYLKETNVATNARKTNLEKIKSLLESKEMLLPIPKTKVIKPKTVTP